MRLLLLLLLLAPLPAAAWGRTGHQVICEIAFQELEGSSRRRVAALIRQDDGFATFAASCSWADDPRQRDTEHYVNFPRGQRAITVAACLRAEMCLFTAIAADSAVLRDPASTARARLEALKFLGHWVGDLHQPLHVSFQDDLGGNRIALRGDPGCDGSLHLAWDVCILRDAFGDDARAIARRIREGITAGQRERWRHDAPEEWADESFAIATAPETRYCVRRRGACWYASDNRVLQPEEPRRSVDFDAAYVAAHARTVELRLAQAGVRLGALLNRILTVRSD